MRTMLEVCQEIQKVWKDEQNRLKAQEQAEKEYSAVMTKLHEEKECIKENERCNGVAATSRNLVG
ncbi:hypothetical protein CN431_13490 [Bacillus cereus]|nr:hypothetical protein CN431_13490 [Bacillus cereus]